MRSVSWQGRLSSAHQQLSQQEQELERLHSLLAAAEDAAKAAGGREDAARAQGREYAERARRAETLCEEADAELAQVRVMRAVLLLCAFAQEGLELQLCGHMIRRFDFQGCVLACRIALSLCQIQHVSLGAGP